MESKSPSYWGHAAHPSAISLAMAPLAGVLLSLLALWMAALPKPTHAVALHLEGACPLMAGRAPHVHTLALGADGAVSWDGEAVAGPAALEARMKAVGVMTPDEQAELRILVHEAATHGAVVAVTAAAQRQGVRRLSVTDAASSFTSDGRCPAME